MTTRFTFGLVLAAVLMVVITGPCIGQDWSGYVAMDDGILLATDVYLPPGGGPWPVVLTRTPYDKSSPGKYPDWCRRLTLNGFACVAQDSRGRYASQGDDTVFRDAGRDGRATLEWISGQPWCNGAIASAGGSAMGITGYAMTPGASPNLKCILAAVATPDFYSHIFSHGGSLRWELGYYWLEGQGSLHMLDEFRSHRLRDEWWDDFDWLGAPQSIDVKALHFGGWWDLYIEGPLESFSRYQKQGGARARGGQHLVMGPWHHFTLDAGWLAQTFEPMRSTGELTFPDNAFPGGWPFDGDGWQLLLNWLGYCLNDEETEAASWPAARVYLMGAVDEAGAPGNRWVDLPDWPPTAATIPYYLTGDGGLSRAQVEHDELELLVDPNRPVPTLGGANHFAEIEVDGRPMGIGAHDQRPVEDRDDVLVFTTPVLEEPVTVMGKVKCRLWVRPDTPDLDLSIRLTDVYPDGRSMLILDGVQRARMRCGDDRECMLTPGVPTEIEIDLWSTAIVFNSGHRIRVSIAGSNWPRFEVNPNDGGDIATGIPTVAEPTILFGGDYPSALELPVIRTYRRTSGTRSPG